MALGGCGLEKGDGRGPADDLFIELVESNGCDWKERKLSEMKRGMKGTYGKG